MFFVDVDMWRFSKVCMRHVRRGWKWHLSPCLYVSADFRRVPELVRPPDWSRVESCEPIRARLVFQPGSGGQLAWKTAESVKLHQTVQTHRQKEALVSLFALRSLPARRLGQSCGLNYSYTRECTRYFIGQFCIDFGSVGLPAPFLSMFVWLQCGWDQRGTTRPPGR